MLFALRSIRRSMARPVLGASSRLRFPNRACSSERKTGVRLHHLPLAFTGSGLVPTQGSRQNGPLAFGRLALAVALVGPARHQLRRRCSSRVRVWPFPPSASERKRSQTLNFKGGNRSRLTPNPLLKSASVASRLRFGRTKPKAARGTTSPFRVSTGTARNGRGRRASVATTCWCLPKWPIRPTRASSSFSRKKSRRASPSVRQTSESGGADPRRSPILIVSKVYEVLREIGAR